MLYFPDKLPDSFLRRFLGGTFKSSSWSAPSIINNLDKHFYEAEVENA